MPHSWWFPITICQPRMYHYWCTWSIRKTTEQSCHIINPILPGLFFVREHGGGRKSPFTYLENEIYIVFKASKNVHFSDSYLSIMTSYNAKMTRYISKIRHLGSCILDFKLTVQKCHCKFDLKKSKKSKEAKTVKLLEETLRERPKI